MPHSEANMLYFDSPRKRTPLSTLRDALRLPVLRLCVKMSFSER